MRDIAGLTQDLFQTWVVAPSVRHALRHGLAAGEPVLAFVFVDTVDGISLWIDGPCEVLEDGTVLSRGPLPRPQDGFGDEPLVVPWGCFDGAALRLVPRSAWARLGLETTPSGLTRHASALSPETLQPMLADTRLDPFRIAGHPHRVTAIARRTTTDGATLEVEQVPLRLTTASNDGVFWAGSVERVPTWRPATLSLGQQVMVSVGAEVVLENYMVGEMDEPIWWSCFEEEATACTELGDLDGAERAWRRMVSESGRMSLVLGDFARFLETYRSPSLALPVYLEAIETHTTRATGEHYERRQLGELEVAFAGCLIVLGDVPEARLRLAPWLVDDTVRGSAREAWEFARTRAEAQAAQGDLRAIWSCALALERGSVRLQIQARFIHGTWHFRRAWAPMWDGAVWANDPPRSDLRSVVPPLTGWTVRSLNPVAWELLDEEQAAQLEPHARAFGVAWDELVRHLASVDTGGVAALIALLQRPVWEHVLSTGPTGPDARAQRYEKRLFDARVAQADPLPLEDLDLVIGAALEQTTREDGDLPSRTLTALRAMLPALAARAPWARDLARPALPAQVALRGCLAGEREVQLVHDTRRWGIALDGDDPVWLGSGLGFELMHRACSPRASADELGEALRAHAYARRFGIDPRVPAAVFADPERELLMAWSRGHWWYRLVRLGAEGRRFKTPKTSTWRKDLDRLMFRHGPPELAPIHIHPMVAEPLKRTFGHVRALCRSQVEWPWRSMLEQACRGEQALAQGPT